MPEDTSSVGFKTSLFGFKKADVLACIEKMAAEAKQKEDEDQSRAQELQKTVDGLKENEAILLEKTRDVCDQLSAQNKRNAEIEKQAGELREQLRRSEDEAALYKKRLFAKEQETLLLKGDKADLQQQLEQQRQAAEQAQRQMEQKVAAAAESARQDIFAAEENAEQRVEQARQQAQKEAVRQKAVMAAGAQDIADSVAVLKTQLAEVDAKIAAAAGELQRTTAALHAALDGAEQNLELLGAQMRQFPQPAPGAKLPEPAPAQQEAQPEPPAQKAQPQTAAGRRSLSALLLDKLARMLGE